MQNEMFKEKYELYGNMLYKIAFLYLRNLADVEDALQETFIKLIYKAPVFNNGDQEKAWLIRVISNICLNMLKKRKKYSFFSAEILNEKKEEQNYGEVLNCILSLPDKYKAVVHLYYYLGYSVTEISSVLKISIPATKMRLKRARNMLRMELED